ncbi:MAG TPA: M48 family metallopeptidase [Nevskiales bacterium]|nr:M48 family metallopeptidase [Nevskiales bacterium]
MKNPLPGLLALALLTACATSPLGRKTLRFFPEGEMAQMGAAAFQETREKTPESKDGKQNAYVTCIAGALTREVPGDQAWEVVVFEDKAANAFALPGGKIGVYTGLLRVARSQDQLAAVIGHEIAHVTAQHANERVSTAFAAQAGLNIVDAIYGGTSAGQNAMALLGLGTQVGILLPFGRAQESEADLLGLDTMARAGFDPREAVTLWQNMAQAGGGAPPEFLSTHPSHDTRIEDLQKRMPEALKLYDAARVAGKKPKCG